MDAAIQMQLNQAELLKIREYSNQYRNTNEFASAGILWNVVKGLRKLFTELDQQRPHWNPNDEAHREFETAYESMQNALLDCTTEMDSCLSNFGLPPGSEPHETCVAMLGESLLAQLREDRADDLDKRLKLAQVVVSLIPNDDSAHAFLQQLRASR